VGVFLRPQIAAPARRTDEKKAALRAAFVIYQVH